MPEMLITFGMQLDGQRATQPGNRLGALTVGPQGLLDILEGQLGLLAVRPCAAQRAAAYRACLAQCDNGQRFYHASFSADELGVAATLLAWRDDLYLHGWDGRAKAVASQRINDLAEVEADACEVVPPSIGQRLQQVAEALAVRRACITNVYLSDAWEVYPLAWQRVLQRLPHAQLPNPSGAAPGFLGQLQAVLQARPSPPCPGRMTEASGWFRRRPERWPLPGSAAHCPKAGRRCWWPLPTAPAWTATWQVRTRPGMAFLAAAFCGRPYKSCR